MRISGKGGGEMNLRARKNPWKTALKMHQRGEADTFQKGNKYSFRKSRENCLTQTHMRTHTRPLRGRVHMKAFSYEGFGTGHLCIQKSR